ELVQTLLENEDKTRAASEMADLLYHAMVLLKLKDVKMEEVLEVLRKRLPSLRSETATAPQALRRHAIIAAPEQNASARATK
ncbi:hypothetical protein BHE74_00059624, partial [Ensete ventricosum]